MMFYEHRWICEIADAVPLGSIAQLDRATPFEKLEHVCGRLRKL